LVKAASKEGVPYIMPNTYGPDITNENLVSEIGLAAPALQRCGEIESTGVSSYIVIVCGMWYKWSSGKGEP
jgi:hypothetical protein